MSKTMGDMISDGDTISSFDSGDYVLVWRSGNSAGERNRVISQLNLTAAFPQPSDTIANWISSDPVIEEGVIALVSDENAYVVGNGSDVFSALELQYGPGKVKSLKDSDISASDSTYSMTTINGYNVGYRGRFSWYNGDGSNDFQFTDVTGITLDGIDFSEWNGNFRGTGLIDIVKTGEDEWQTLNDGVFDTWGKTYESEVYPQYAFVDGHTERQGRIHDTNATEANMWSLLSPILPTTGDSASLTGNAVNGFYNSVIIRTDSDTLTIYAHDDGVGVDTITITSTASGTWADSTDPSLYWRSANTRWTTGTPRKS